MASPASASSQPALEPSKTRNPIVGFGRKVKSVLGTDQRPSVRLRREIPPARELQRLPSADGNVRNTQSFEDKEAVNRSGKGVGATMRLWFSGDEESTSSNASENEYDPDTVDLLDVMDPEVSTLNTITNVQNSLFVPRLGRIVNRRPTYRISEDPEDTRVVNKLKAALKNITNQLSNGEEEAVDTNIGQYAVLPDGETLQGWSREQKEELDDQVRHELHSRRARMKRSMKGFWQYVRRPFGLFITVYATLITLFGAAWVFFLIGWISVGSKRDYVVNVVDNVLVALFAIIGDGLAPFRAVDTYHMIYIAHYHRITWKRREKLGLPELTDHNDLPDQRKEDAEPDLESLVARKMPRGVARFVAPRIPKRYAWRMINREGINGPSNEYTVLSEAEQAKLEHHERKFSKSHTFYKPHETETHFAFPLKLLVAIVVLLDLHSCLQISLGACTWGISYKTRPFALTTVILCCSITCNIMGGVLISRGDKRTRKKDVIDRMMRQQLTAEVIERMETKWIKEAEERGEMDPAVRRRREEEREEQEKEEIKQSWKVVPKLPKVLLGKDTEDHRQPSLPQKERRSNSAVEESGSGSTTPKKDKSKSTTALPAVPENGSQAQRSDPTVSREGPPKEGTGQKIMRLVRRADFDQS